MSLPKIKEIDLSRLPSTIVIAVIFVAYFHYEYKKAVDKEEEFRKVMQEEISAIKGLTSEVKRAVDVYTGS